MVLKNSEHQQTLPLPLDNLALNDFHTLVERYKKDRTTLIYLYGMLGFLYHLMVLEAPEYGDVMMNSSSPQEVWKNIQEVIEDFPSKRKFTHTEVSDVELLTTVSYWAKEITRERANYGILIINLLQAEIGLLVEVNHELMLRVNQNTAPDKAIKRLLEKYPDQPEVAEAINSFLEITQLFIFLATPKKSQKLEAEGITKEKITTMLEEKIKNFPGRTGEEAKDEELLRLILTWGLAIVPFSAEGAQDYLKKIKIKQ